MSGTTAMAKVVCAFCAIWASEITAAVLYILCGGLG